MQLIHFGARYYDSDLSVWLSVDPMASKYPSMSAYMYCAGNPVMLVDPDGMDDGWYEGEDKQSHFDPKVNSQQDMADQGIGGRYIGASGGEAGKDGSQYNLNADGTKTQHATYEVSAKKNVSPAVPATQASTQNNATPWMNSAMNEYNKGVIEIPGSRANPNIIKYLHSAGNKSNSDETPWCAAFVHYNLGQAGIKGAGAVGNSYLSWGKKIDKPVYGAIAIFKSGHVGFYAGSKGSNYIILHGNWSDKVSLSNYIKPSEIRAFVVPASYIIR